MTVRDLPPVFGMPRRSVEYRGRAYQVVFDQDGPYVIYQRGPSMRAESAIPEHWCTMVPCAKRDRIIDLARAPDFERAVGQ